MEKGDDPHIILFPFPSQGHINPLLQFSKRLIPNGIKVTLLTILYVSENLNLQGTYSNSVTIEVISDGSENRQDTDTMRQTLDRFREKMSKNLENYLQKAMNSPNPPRFILYDSTMPWVLEVAKAFGLARAPFYTQSCALNSINYHVLHGQLTLPPESPTISLPSMPLLSPNDLPAYDYDPASTETIIEFLTSQYSNIQDADLLFCNTFDKLEGEVCIAFELLMNSHPLFDRNEIMSLNLLTESFESSMEFHIKSVFNPNRIDRSLLFRLSFPFLIDFLFETYRFIIFSLPFL